MDADRFDTVTRTLTGARSRRGALLSLFGGTFGLLALTETDARNKGTGKGKGKGNKKKKKKKSPPPPPPCIPEAPETTCAPGCGTRLNTCGQVVVCACPSGQGCLSNGSCGIACTSGAQCAGCTAGCAPANTEGQRFCWPLGPACDSQPTCSSTSTCPSGTQCLPCSVPTDLRCYPLCTG